MDPCLWSTIYNIHFSFHLIRRLKPILFCFLLFFNNEQKNFRGWRIPRPFTGKSSRIIEILSFVCLFVCRSDARKSLLKTLWFVIEGVVLMFILSLQASGLELYILYLTPAPNWIYVLLKKSNERKGSTSVSNLSVVCKIKKNLLV